MMSNIMNVQQTHRLTTETVRNQQTIKTVDTEETRKGFADVLSQQIQNVNQLQHQASMETQKFIVGESENIHDMMIAREEASVALNMMIQVRNKLVDGLQELKNTQI